MLNKKVEARFEKHFGKNARRGKTILAMEVLTKYITKFHQKYFPKVIN